MDTFGRLFDLATGSPIATEETGPAHRARIAILAMLASLGFAAAYGVAVGSTSLGLLVGDLYKVPMVLLLSAASAVPAMLLSWKLAGSPNRASTLFMGLVSGNFTASLVLAVMAPLVALYYHTSAHLGSTLAMGTLVLAVVVGVVTLVRSVMNRVPRDLSSLAMAIPVGAMAAMELLVLLQLIAVASPILPQTTVFDHGLDGLLH